MNIYFITVYLSLYCTDRIVLDHKYLEATNWLFLQACTNNKNDFLRCFLLFSSFRVQPGSHLHAFLCDVEKFI